MELKVYISVLRMCDPGLHSVTGADGAGGESRAWIMTLAGAAVGRVARGAGDLEPDRGRHRAFLGAGNQVRDRQPAFLGAFFLDFLLSIHIRYLFSATFPFRTATRPGAGRSAGITHEFTPRPAAALESRPKMPQPARYNAIHLVSYIYSTAVRYTGKAKHHAAQSRTVTRTATDHAGW